MPGWSDIPRRIVRGIVPQGTYARLAQMYNSAIGSQTIGSAEYRRLMAVSREPLGGPPATFRFPGIDSPVFVRPGTTDATVFEDVLLRRMYDCLPGDRRIDFIIDAGANAGYSALFLLHRYPAARLVAIEPDPANCELVRMNIAPFTARANVMQTAIWPRRIALRIRPSERADGISVEPAAVGEQHDCMSIDPLSILRDAGAERIGLFKCDIEGGEEFLFATSPDVWLERTDAIMIEIHSPAAHEAVYGATQRHGFQSFRHRELHVFYRGG